MKKVIFILCMIVSVSAYAQTKLYVHPNADEYVKNTKKIVILPFKVQIKLKPKQLKDVTPKQLEQMNKDEALSIQKAMYSWFLTRKKRGELLVEVQNPTETNALLKKNRIDIFSIGDVSAKRLGQILGAEAIVMGTYESSKPMTDAVGVGLTLLTGALFNSNSATMNMDILNAKDNELVVNYLKKVRGGLGMNSDDLINILMRKASRRIPYTE